MITPIERQQIVDILTESKALIANKEHWCARYTALDKNGQVTWKSGPDAVRWCALGALGKTVSTMPHRRNYHAVNMAESLLWACAEENYSMGVSRVNDARGHKEVMYLYDAAISRAKDGIL